ncbi:MAG: GGDEF domain-containing protein [Smithella sp.]
MKDAELNTLQQLLNDRGWRLRFNEELEREFQQDHARRPGDLAARYGGEEFALVLTNSSAEQARIIAEQMRKKIMETTIKYEKSVSTNITVSLGVASMVPGIGQANPDALILEADQAMYRAKRSGRNRVVVSGQPDDDQAVI